MGAKTLTGLLLILLIIGGINPVSPHPESEAELKPLEVKGPTLAEVNETISFTVTSNGVPVKGSNGIFRRLQKRDRRKRYCKLQDRLRWML